MKKNVGSVDKIARIILGLVILIIGVLAQSWWGLIGLIPLVTGLVGNCPLYPILGISTCKTDDKK
ncbi:hypothetical protein B6D60_05610 [candidate division KSB1 bacterium 4484_87]|nr:MAG: hypothetical protein B6D60_05610 [candidate division KSB1 bacterium 4484_87]